MVNTHLLRSPEITHLHGHQRGPGRSTDSLRIEVRESQTFFGHAINIGGLDLGGAEATDIAIAQIIREDNYEVRFRLSSPCTTYTECKHNQ